MKIHNKILLLNLITALIICLFLSIATDCRADSTSVSVNAELGPINPEFIKFNKKILPGNILGYRPPPYDLSPLSIPGLTIYHPPPIFTSQYPASFDLRALGRVTSVKSQEQCGVCWTFSTYGSLESYLMPLENWDFSENHMKNTNGFDGPYGVCGNGPGHSAMSTAYLARWSGPVNESDDPYFSDSSPPNAKAQKHVQDVLWLPERRIRETDPIDNSWIKLALMQYGGVQAQMSFYPELFYDEEFYTYYLESRNLGYGLNHGVTIVGWDDHFNRFKFPPGESGNYPPGNGAFIVKNSHGEDFGENGYFYVSYYDAILATGRPSGKVFTAEPADNYDNIYQYDPLGITKYLSTRSIFNEDRGKYANVFTANGIETLSAVSFYVLSPYETKGKIDVYLDPNYGPINLDSEPVSTTQVGPFDFAGYRTVHLDEKVLLAPGQRFSIVLDLIVTHPDLEDQFFPGPFAVEHPVEDYSSDATANPGESYVSPDGQEWSDITTLTAKDLNGNEISLKDTNVCIKAFTNNWRPVFISEVKRDPSSISKLVWKIGNAIDEETLVRPIAEFYKMNTNLPGKPPGLHKVGTIASGDYYLDGEGKKHKIKKDGWAKILPGESITVYSGSKIPSVANYVSYNLYINKKAEPIFPFSRLSQLFKLYIHVVDTIPQSYEIVNPSTNIEVVFDRDIVPGPGLHQIKLSSLVADKEVFSTVSNNVLIIQPNGPLFDYRWDVLDDIDWEVRIPWNAVTDQYGNPLEQDYSWQFTSTNIP